MASLCPPVQRAESAYWHGRRDWHHDLETYDVGPSQLLYAGLKHLTMCMSNLTHPRPFTQAEADEYVVSWPEPRATGPFPAEVLRAWKAQLQAYEDAGFPPVESVDWSRLPDTWYEQCYSKQSYAIHAGLYAQALRRLMRELVLRPLGVPDQVLHWDGPHIDGLLSPYQQRRVLVLDSGELFGDPVTTTNKVYQHAGLPLAFEPQREGTDAEPQKINSGQKGTEQLAPTVRAQLEEFYDHEMALLARLTGRAEPWFPSR